jgi:O-antigen/teichoic acid export membrane protein
LAEKRLLPVFRSFIEQIRGLQKRLLGKDILEVLQHSKNYFLGDMLGQGILFLSIPILTRLLTPAEYGTFQVFRSYVAIFLTLFTLNFHGSVLRYFFENKEDFKDFVGLSVLGSYGFLVLSSLLLFFFRAQILDLLGVSQEVLVLILVFTAIRIIDMIFNQISAAGKKSLRYSLVNNIRTVLSYGIGIGLIFLFAENKFYALIAGHIIAGLLVGIYTLQVIRRSLAWNISVSHIRYIFNYSVVLIPYLLSGVLLDQLDRIIIHSKLGASDAGLYSFAYNIGMIVSLATDALSNALVPDWFRMMKNQEYERVNQLVFNVFGVTLVISFGAILFSREIIEILSDKEFHAALSIFPIVVVGYIFDALSKVYLRSIGYTNKMLYVSALGMVVAVVNFVLNIIFLPQYGYVAGAYVTVFSFFLLFILAWWVAKFLLRQPVTPLNIFFKPSAIFILAVLLYFYITTLPIGGWQSLALRLALFVVSSVMLFWSGEWNKSRRLT